MTRGRKPTPTPLKIANGVRKSRINADEPKASGTPACPEHLDEEAKKEWRRISKDLSAMGILSSIDRAALAAYCQCWSEWVAATKMIQETGPVLKASSGELYHNPYKSVANKAMAGMMKVLVEFGMTPSSRSRVHASPQSKEIDEFEQGLGLAN